MHYEFFKQHKQTRGIQLNTLLKRPVFFYGWVLFFIIIFTLVPFTITHVISLTTKEGTVLELNEKIKAQKNKISDLKKQIEVYEKNIKARRAEKASLENDIALIEDSLAKTQLSIQASEEELEQLNLELEGLHEQISQKEQEIDLQKLHVGSFLKTLYEQRERDYLELFFMNENFSQFFDSVHYLEQTEKELYASLVRLKTLREQLATQRTHFQKAKDEQTGILATLQKQRDSYEEQKSGRQQLIVQSILSAEKFQQLLEESRREQYAIDADITNLERTVREKLNLRKDGKISLSWPVDSSRGISAYFHDKDYPFRHVFEHPAIDIRAYQGTYVKAAEDGYIARTKDGGKTGYSYIMILHDQGVATVYGHVSRIMVDQDTYVKKGQIVGLSGGSPGTNGAGKLTTGPHLHFEVRANGVPDDPLKYLP